MKYSDLVMLHYNINQAVLYHTLSDKEKMLNELMHALKIIQEEIGVRVAEGYMANRNDK